MLVSLLPVVLAVVLSYYFLDIPIARFFYELRRVHPLFRHYTEHLPDLLLTFVVVITALSWALYLARYRRTPERREASFLRLTGTCVPLAFAAKTVLQFVFSRADVRLWLHVPWVYGFHWFRGGTGYSGFPSGHMTVFSALAAAMWMAYPRIRGLAVGGLLALAGALIVTDYHYLSDVIAGTYLGIAVCVISARRLTRVAPELASGR